MGKRSLKASFEGIRRAKEALERKQLTQRSLSTGDGLIASWTTINRFFNHKGIDRYIFIEICKRLDLDWEVIAELVAGLPEINTSGSELQSVAEAFPAISEVADSLLAAVQQRAQATRMALIPRILQPILRTSVRDRYLSAIQRGTRGGLQRAIAIVGPAGYGKSTILGTLYDALLSDETPWVAIALCALLPLNQRCFPSTEDLAQAFGEAVVGQSRSILEIVQALNQYGRGVLLIDTLDLVVNRPFVAAFTNLVQALLEQDVTVVFTCRDYEHNEFLEPAREKLAIIASAIDRHTISGFTNEEIREAAQKFFQMRSPATPERGEVFATQILSLSADSRSLQAIIQNPLLLALLCDLFANDEQVPADLTVSKLYKRYWYEKIAFSRSEHSHSSQIAIAKNQVCLTLARLLFELSEDKLCESLYEDELEIDLEPHNSAYNDLLSEGVIERLSSLKIHFFHQTLLEYAIAYWLTRSSARAARDRFFALLCQPNASYTHTYWLPILRQHLTIIEDESEFEALIQRLDQSDMGIFGVIAFAAISRDRSNALLHLLPTALKLGEAYQRRLRQALESAPRHLAEASWTVLLAFLEQAEHTTAINTAKMVSTLLERWWSLLKHRLPEAMVAVARRSSEVNRQVHQKGDDRALLFGWLLQHCLPLLQAEPDLDLLVSLQEQYFLLGHRTAAMVLQIYQQPQVPTAAKQALLNTMMQRAVPPDKTLEQEMTAFTKALLPALVSSPVRWSHSLDILNHSLSKGWKTVLARSIGQWATHDTDLLAELLSSLDNTQGNGLRCHFIAIGAAIEQGAGSAVVAFLEHRPLPTLNFSWLQSLVSFLKHYVASFPSEAQEQLALWLSSATPEQRIQLLPLLDALAEHAPTARHLIEQAIAQLPTAERTQHQIRQLRFVPIEEHPPLASLNKSAQLSLIQLYREQARECALARQQLLIAAQGRIRDVALAAVREFDQLPINQLQVSDLLPLLQSIFPGIRVVGLQAILRLSEQGRSLTAVELTRICTILASEDNQAVVRPLCELVTLWIQVHHQIPARVADVIGEIPTRLIVKGTFEGGTARVLIAALKVMAQSEDPHLNSQHLSQWIRKLLTAIHLIKIPHSETEMIDLLSAGDRLDKRLLTSIIQEDCPLLAEKHWVRNIFAVIKTVCRVDRPTSERLDWMLCSDWCLPEIRAVILEVRGG